MTPAEIRTIRNARGWSQQRLADAVGVSVRSVKYWEAGTKNMSRPIELLLKML